MRMGHTQEGQENLNVRQENVYPWNQLGEFLKTAYSLTMQ